MLQSGPKILYICRLGARIRGCEEVEVAISGRNVGRGTARGRGRGGRGTRLVVGETSTSADPGQGQGTGRSRGGRGTTLIVADPGQSSILFSDH